MVEDMQPAATSSSNLKVECGNVCILTWWVWVFAAVLFVVFSASLQAQEIPSQKSSECPGDTVDRMGQVIARQSRAFLGKLSAAVLEENKKQVATMIHYPMSVHITDKTLQIHNSAEFTRNYERIMNASVKAVIVDEKSSRCLFSSPEGFMVGDGEVWFKEFSPGVFKIVAFNLGDSPNSDPAKP
jgi:hypothetical protein